jgi:type II secretory pathway pseudopilin PulG
MTMIELLIVVAVMVILMAISLPMMKTGIEGRKLRETARQVNTTVELAKSLAAETGRYAGIILDTEALPEDTSRLFARRIFMAETPPPYAGDVAGATALINTSTTPYRAGFVSASSANLGNIAKVDDLIRFDYRKPDYVIKSIVAGAGVGDWIVEFSGSPPPAHNVSLPYQIIRRPEKSSVSPFELPNGAVIDFSSSGFGSSDTSLATATAYNPVTIVFGPSGSLVAVMGISPSTSPTETLHLLIGNLENLGPLNLADPSTLWVSIGHHTGRVTTAESGVSASATTLEDAREFAQSGQSMGGR